MIGNVLGTRGEQKSAKVCMKYSEVTALDVRVQFDRKEVLALRGALVICECIDEFDFIREFEKRTDEAYEESDDAHNPSMFDCHEISRFSDKLDFLLSATLLGSAELSPGNAALCDHAPCISSDALASLSEFDVQISGAAVRLLYKSLCSALFLIDDEADYVCHTSRGRDEAFVLLGQMEDLFEEMALLRGPAKPIKW